MHAANMAENRDWKKHWKGETRNWRTMKSRPRKRICNETRTKRNNSNKKGNSRSGSSSNKRKRKRSRKEQGEEEQKGKIVKCVPWIVYRLWYFLTLLFQDGCPTASHMLAPNVVGSPREHCFGFFSIFNMLCIYCHIYPEMFATRITPLAQCAGWISWACTWKKMNRHIPGQMPVREEHDSTTVRSKIWKFILEWRTHL